MKQNFSVLKKLVHKNEQGATVLHLVLAYFFMSEGLNNLSFVN